jgi:hypothetical protein
MLKVELAELEATCWVLARLCSHDLTNRRGGRLIITYSRAADIRHGTPGHKSRGLLTSSASLGYRCRPVGFEVAASIIVSCARRLFGFVAIGPDHSGASVSSFA